MRKPKFRPGDVVLMRGENGTPDELGTVDAAEGWDYEEDRPGDPEAWRDGNIMYIVTVEKRIDPTDDLLREVLEEQMQESINMTIYYIEPDELGTVDAAAVDVHAKETP